MAFAFNTTTAQSRSFSACKISSVLNVAVRPQLVGVRQRHPQSFSFYLFLYSAYEMPCRSFNFIIIILYLPKTVQYICSKTSIEPLAVAVSPYGWLMTPYGWLAG